MHFFHIFLTISAMLAVSAVPLPANSCASRIQYGPSRRMGRPLAADMQARPLQDPKVAFPTGIVPLDDRDNTRAAILDDFHIFSAQSPASAKMTKLARVEKDWVYLHDRQFLDVRYHMGMRKKTRTVPGGLRRIYRDIPPEKPMVLSFNHKIPVDENLELTGLVAKCYNALPPNSPYRRARVIRVEQGWRPGGGNTDEIRDHAMIAAHTTLIRTDKNMIGVPHTIRRPLTVSFGDEVEKGSRDLIEKKVREQHASLSFTHKANVALVVGGLYKNTQGKDEAQVGYYEFPDCPKSQDQRYKDHGRYPVALE